MSHISKLLCGFFVISMLFQSSCSSTKHASVTTGSSGYRNGFYHLSEAEEALTIDQLRTRIKQEARICADPHAHKVRKSRAIPGLSMTLGPGVNPQSRKPTPAMLSRAKMRAYSERLVELGQPRVSLAGEIETAIAERNAALAGGPI